MKSPLLAFLGCALLFAAGCSTVGSRIARHRDAFESWPLDVQQNVQTGQIELGYTPEQVRVALGEPARTFTRTDADGISEVWAYRDRKPRFGFGVGIGVGRGSTSYGGGVAVGGRDYFDDETMRVVFTGGRVSAIETTE